ncbi:MAG: ATP-binding protein [Pseudomonadota bacterium]|mgnify:FL=1
MQAEPRSPAETAQLLHELLIHHIELEMQSERLLRERLKEITCLYSIRHDMVLESPLDELCQHILEHLIAAMQFPEITAAMIELDGEQFVSGKYSNELAHGLQVQITVNGKACGQLQVFYCENKPFLLPEEQNLINAIALDLQWWLERKQTANALESSLEKIKMIQSALDAHAIVAITDRYGKIIYANDKFCAVSKYSREELLGQDHRIINSGFHPKEFMRELWKTIAQGHIWKGELRNRAKDGSFYWVDTTIAPFLDAAGKPYQYAAIRTEVTERKRLEQLMEKQIVELARSNAELEQFAYVATHDLQEPLRAVTSCVQLLKQRYEGQLDAHADEFITHAVDGTRRMQMLINDLLTYSQINADQTPVPVDCAVLLDNVLANLATAIAENGAVVTHEPLPTVSGNPSQLTQMFQNLISNALKFRGKRPPEIHIGAVLKAGEWVFSVADNGIGMEPQYFERVFRVSQRLHTRTEYPGTGIGLAICKKVAEYHGGRIWVESQPDQGSTFYFTIPEKK